MFYVEIKSIYADPWARLENVFENEVTAHDWALDFTADSGSYSRVVDDLGETRYEF